MQRKADARKFRADKVVYVGLALVVGLSACNGVEDDATPDAAPETEMEADDAGESDEELADECDMSALSISYATKSATNQGWILINQGAEDAATDLGVGSFSAVGPPIENDLSGQLNVVEDLLSAQPDALAIAPVDSTGIVPVVEQANADGVPVVAIDTAIEGGDVASFVATDNLAAAQLQAEVTAEAIGGSGTVVLINGSQAQQTGRDRRDGFADTMEAQFADIEVLEVQTEWDSAAGQDGLEALLTGNDVDAVAHAWDGATVATVALLEREGLLEDTVVVGFDGAPDALAMMLDGKVDLIVAQQLYRMGYVGIETAVAAACGDVVEERIDTGAALLTPETVEQFIADNPDELEQFIAEEREE